MKYYKVDLVVDLKVIKILRILILQSIYYFCVWMAGLIQTRVSTNQSTCYIHVIL